MQIRKIGFVLLTVIFTAGAGRASQDDSPSGLRGPVVGYVFDALHQSIRAINGIPGSSLLGQPIAVPFPITTAAFAPRGSFAVAANSDDRGAVVLRNLGGNLRIAEIPGAIVGVNLIALNAGATAAALVASDARQLQVVHGLPADPTVGPSLDLSSIPGTITALAIDGTGTKILIAVSDDHGALFLAEPERGIAPRLIGDFSSPSALTFVNGEQDAIVADAAVNELLYIRDFSGAAETFRLAGERDGIVSPSGLQVSPDNRELYIANAVSRTLDVWDFEAQAIRASFPLDAQPTRLTALQGSSIFILNEVGDHPLILLDTAGNPAIYFVPASEDR